MSSEVDPNDLRIRTRNYRRQRGVAGDPFQVPPNTEGLRKTILN